MKEFIMCLLLAEAIGITLLGIGVSEVLKQVTHEHDVIEQCYVWERPADNKYDLLIKTTYRKMYKEQTALLGEHDDVIPCVKQRGWK